MQAGTGNVEYVFTEKNFGQFASNEEVQKRNMILLQDDRQGRWLTCAVRCLCRFLHLVHRCRQLGTEQSVRVATVGGVVASGFSGARLEASTGPGTSQVWSCIEGLHSIASRQNSTPRGTIGTILWALQYTRLHIHSARMLLLHTVWRPLLGIYLVLWGYGEILW